MRNLTATLCLTIATLIISATSENANAEDKFYAFSTNEIGTTREAILSINDNKLEIFISTDCGECNYRYDTSICEKTEIRLKNTFKTYCHGTWTTRKIEGSLKKAELDVGGQAGGAIFHFIPFSRKKSFETYREKTSAISTGEFIEAQKRARDCVRKKYKGC